MQAETIIQVVEDARMVQRDKLAALHAQVPTIRAFDDADFALVLRAIRKRINSPNLVAERAALLDELTRDRVAIPVGTPPPAPPPPAPVVAVAAGTDLAARFEGEIAEDPEARDLYLAYGDWLASNGDPRGEMIAVGRELAKNPGNKEVLAAHRELAPKLLGPLADCEDLVTGVQWHMGFIKSCRLAYTYDRFNNKRPRIDLVQVLEWLLDDPGPARFLQHLTVGVVVHDDNRYDKLCAVLARRRRASLRSLFLGDFESDDCELNWAQLGDISSVWAAVPGLRELTLRAGSMRTGPIDLPRLEKLATITGGLDAASLGHIAGASWPSLHTMSLQIGRGTEGAATSVELVAPILAAERVPKLRSLGIVNCELTDELCARIPESAILPQLEVLDLSMGTMSDAGAALLAARAEKFAHLRKLVVEDNYLTDQSRDLLAGTGVEVVFGDQRDDEGDAANRYASAIE